MRLAGGLLLVWFISFSVTHSALAEGSAEFDAADTSGFLTNDQAVHTASVLFVDIVDAKAEKICYRGVDADFSVYRPAPDDSVLVATLRSGQCAGAVDGVNGAYILDIETQNPRVEWDIRVCAKDVSDQACLNDPANERLGRLWSYDWSFQSNLDYSRRWAVNGSVYAIVPGGGEGHDAVVEMQMTSVSGARYHLFANSYGPQASTGERIGRSVAPDADSVLGRVPPYTVQPEFPIYLNPPAVARYNWITPVVSDIQLRSACGTAVVQGVAPSTLSFVSNVLGQYIMICDVNRDDIYDFADDADYSSFGAAVVGTNVVTWDGTTKGGALAEPGDYACVVRLNVGEFHFMAQDIETSDPGIRMYRVERDKIARTPLKMFWDDALIADDPEPISNGALSPNGAPPEGLDPGPYDSPAEPYVVDNGVRRGNARAWGNFDEDGKGNNTYLDQFTSAASAQTEPLVISVMTADGDPDGDGLPTLRECALGSDPRARDSDADHVDDNFEASLTEAADHDADGLLDIIDPDDDGDSLLTRDELGPEEDGDGDPSDARDSDDDGIPDYLDADSDADSVPDVEDVAPTDRLRCRDTDGDTCDDCSQGMGPDPANDGVDSDADGLCDAGFGDIDGDGIDDEEDLDIDNDGIPNLTEGTVDTDKDGIANLRDLDSDGDGLPDILEAGGRALDLDGDGRIDQVDDRAPRDGLHDPLAAIGGELPLPDSDGDGVPDYLDTDADDDGLLDKVEAGAALLDSARDQNRNGLPDGVDPDRALPSPGRPLTPPDSDGDALPDYRDVDDDDDARDTQIEVADARAFPRYGADVDVDGTLNWLDTDSDGDGASDLEENAGDGDSNADSVPDYLQAEVQPPDSDQGGDRDSDNDGVLDVVERPSGVDMDSDGDGIADHLDADDDGDGVPTRQERPDGQDVDTDGDGNPDYLDPDDDGDGVPTATERPDGQDLDTDENAVPNYLDPDDDGDGLSTFDERPNFMDIDTDGDGIPNHLDPDDDGDEVPTRAERSEIGEDQDSDADLIPDHLDVDDDGDGILTRAELLDGDGDGTADYLEIAPTAASEVPAEGTLAGGALCTVGVPGATAVRSGAGLVFAVLALVWMGLRRRRVVFWLCLLSLGGSMPAHAQVALDQFKPAPLASDGFALSRPDVSGHLVFGASLWVDYANDPLVYERVAGDASTQERVVRDHLVLHAGLSLGLGDRVTLFGLLPVHALMDGQNRLTVPDMKPEGAGLGDFALGARGLLLGDAESFAALSGELIARLPTAELANDAQQYSGDSVGSYEPALIGEVRTGPFAVRMRLGARLRKNTQVGNLDLDQELVYGAGVRFRASELVSLHAEAYGSAFFREFFGREQTPLEALLGIKLHPGDIVVGLAAGPGLSHGYGAPDLRVVGMVGYAPAPVVDTDGDGLLDPDDRCPADAEDFDQFEDADGCPDPDNDRDGILDRDDKCPNDAEDRDGFQDEDGCPDPDNDADGILDAQDACPNDAEDRDGFQDEDGCPDPDNDKDGLVDASDKCPDEPEDFDGFEDSDGCPEEGSALVKLTCDRIEIKEAVYFDTDSDVIQARSFNMLNQMVDLLQQATHVRRVRVEGHTDNRGSAEHNLELSKRRAASVLRYLAEHGVDHERLESEGYGLGKPVADNETEEGRASNRRVEFIVVDQATDCTGG